LASAAGHAQQTAPPAAPPAPSAAPRQAAAPGQTSGSPYTFKKSVDEVLIHASVFDDKNRSLTNLNKTNFSIFENNTPQKITFFSHEDAPVSIGLVIDNSGSMREKRPEVNEAALNFVRASNPHDEVFIVNFNDEFYRDADFTNQVSKLQEGLDRIESRGGTALYDALVASLDYLTQHAKNDKKVLLLITDGADNSSRYTLEEAVRYAQAEKGPLIYCVGLVSNDDTRTERNRAKRAMKVLADATGGSAYFPKNLGDVDAITRQIAAAIRDQYTLAYRSNQAQTGFRSIRVALVGSSLRHAQVRTRTGYYQGATAPATAAQ